MADPVADKSGFLRMYMSSHPDTLVAYAKWYGKVEEPIASAEMTAIDSRSMTLTCTLKNGAKKVATVPLEPPLSGYEEVKPRLLEMKAKAQEGLGMIKAPQLSTFKLNTAATVKIGGAISLLCYLTFFPRGSVSPFFYPARTAHTFIGGDFPLQVVWIALGVTHALECLYTFTLCRRHRTGFLVGTGYVLSTFVFGFSVWVELRRRIQQMRIDSVMKVE
ncbi:hypothetical protein EYR40_002641 [Pleurotus pulmonarius]|nr:hypothetical protein EYR40_002641 [Pleurotus pulmonarius]KAF4588287.1 hypothetical protein EYR38_010254 [Pleurotus pulmonarius]